MEGDTILDVDIKDPSQRRSIKIRNANAEEAEMHLLSPTIGDGNYKHHSANSVEDLLGLAPKRHCRIEDHPSQTSVRLTEVFPTDERMQGTTSSWQMPLNLFTTKKSKELGLETSKLPKGIKLFYERQDELIAAYESMATDFTLDELARNIQEPGKIVTRLSQISFLVNLMLMIAKAVAVGMSNSMSIISSLVDSVVDLMSGIIIWWTTHAIKKSSIYVYPVGRSRLEPVAIIILSVIMSLASLEVLISAVKKMIGFASSLDDIANFELPTVIIAASTVVTKFVLAVSFYLIMKKKEQQSGPIDALIQDHRNDTLSNLVAIACGYFGSQQFADKVHTKEIAYVDPAGAIIIGLYIIISWWKTGIAQLKMVTGYTADPTFLSQITWISLNHSPQILNIDTVRAFHFGSKFLVEVDIVLHEDTKLSDSHNIGESLQQKLERLSNVERAFVHVDYEVSHRPQEEHLSGQV